MFVGPIVSSVSGNACATSDWSLSLPAFDVNNIRSACQAHCCVFAKVDNLIADTFELISAQGNESLVWCDAATAGGGAGVP